MTTQLPRLVVFSDDWGRHPSSCQHLVRELLPRYRVDWVNTIGTRRPTLSLHDLRRAAEKLKAWLGPRRDAPGEALPENLTVHSPVLWPGFKNAFERGLNRRLLLRALRPLFEQEPRPAAVLTTASIVADLARETRDRHWVYYCVDDLSAWPGLDADTLRRMEVELLPHVSRTVVVSEVLEQRMRDLGNEADLLLTHGIELAHWGRVAELRAGRTPGDPPVTLYWGNADRRLDTPICLALAERTRLRIVGPRTDVDPALLAAPGVELRDPVPYAELPALAAEADVLVMPYADLEVTRAMQPLKLKEYLATGMGVVTTPLPATREWEAAMDVCADPARFVDLCLARASGPTPAQVAARARLAEEGWDRKASQFEAVFRRGEGDG